MPGAGPKRKGNGFEREVVKLAEGRDLKASRSWGSDGRSRGLREEVDVLVQRKDGTPPFAVQCKRIKELPRWLGMEECINIVAIREDHGRAYAIVDLDLLFCLIRESQSENLTAGPEGSKVKA